MNKLQETRLKVMYFINELEGKGKYVDVDFGICLGESTIRLTYYGNYEPYNPYEEMTVRVKRYSENPTPAELQDGDISGNYNDCLQFLESLTRLTCEEVEA